jgi:hypothetical protein
MSITLSEICDRTGVEVLEHLDRQVTIPVHPGLQFQGDVAIVPSVDRGVAGSPVPAAGIPVVRGESGGNTHALHADGPVFFDELTPTGRDLVLGVMTVPAGSTAYLIHPEHGAMAAGPGIYELRRQREQADIIELVAD